jgi:hypothetical protein
LASAFKPQREDGPPPNCTRTAHPDPADDDGEPSMGSAEDPCGVGAAGVHSLRENDSQVYASNPSSRWVRSVRTECLDHVFIFNERHLQKVLVEYVGYCNRWRPHRSFGQRAPCAPATDASHRSAAMPVLGGLHHVYQLPRHARLSDRLGPTRSPNASRMMSPTKFLRPTGPNRSIRQSAVPPIRRSDAASRVRGELAGWRDGSRRTRTAF